MSKVEKETLQDIGELRVIDEIILPLARKFDSETSAGDDCTYVSFGGKTFAITADVGPRPLIMNLKAHHNDLEAAGWMAVVATVSDIATAGALPLFLTNCIDAPPSLLKSDLKSFMTGYFRALSEFGFKNGGGDIRQGKTLSARVFGVAIVDHTSNLGRSAARNEDKLVVIGPTGHYMSEYILAKNKESLCKTKNFEIVSDDMRFPKPQLNSMNKLAKSKLITSASDTSDGLLGAIDNIGRSSKCGFHLDLKSSMISEDIKNAYDVSGSISPWNLFFSWGDWAVAAVVPKELFLEFTDFCTNSEIEWKLLGSVVEGSSKITASIDKNEIKNVNLIRNENFREMGFNAGLKGHIDYMLRSEIFYNL